MSKYYLIYELGTHHVTIEVSEIDFYKVVTELSNEFEIFKINFIERKEELPFPDPEDELTFIRTKTEYHIINYWGDKQTIGYIKEIK